MALREAADSLADATAWKGGVRPAPPTTRPCPAGPASRRPRLLAGPAPRLGSPSGGRRGDTDVSKHGGAGVCIGVVAAINAAGPHERR